MKTILKAAMSYHPVRYLASLLMSICVTLRRRVSLRMFHLWMKRKFSGKQPCLCPIYTRQQCKKFCLFFFPECFKIFHIDFVNETWSILTAWEYSTPKKWFSIYLQEKRGRWYLLFGQHTCGLSYLFKERTLCQVHEEKGEGMWADRRYNYIYRVVDMT